VHNTRILQTYSFLDRKLTIKNHLSTLVWIKFLYPDYLLLHQNLSFQIKEEHFLYLGLLVIGICYGKWETTKKDVSTCFSKFQELTTGWQGKYLSMVGRLVLIKAVMGTLPAFLYRTCVVPKGIQDIFKWCMCQFLLGGSCSLHL